MPVAVRHNPFGEQPKLRTPQARVLAALMPTYLDDPISEWPLLTRAALSLKAGYTAISGTTTRALNGIHEGSSSGDPHPGLLKLGLVEEQLVDVDGITETNYRITAAGVSIYQEYIRVKGGKLPELKDASTCINDRYKEQA
jgi:hypothetical protein